MTERKERQRNKQQTRSLIMNFLGNGNGNNGNKRMPDPELPRVENIPGAPTRARRPDHREYSDEAARAAQRYLDQVSHIEGLTVECDEWRARALAAEAEVERFANRERELLAVIDQKNEAFFIEREQIRQSIAVLSAQYTTASKILLDGFQVIEKLDGVKAKIDLPQIEAAVTHADDPHDKAPD
jgi:hypothetical protein